MRNDINSSSLMIGSTWHATGKVVQDTKPSKQTADMCKCQSTSNDETAGNNGAYCVSIDSAALSKKETDKMQQGKASPELPLNFDEDALSEYEVDTV